MGASANTRIDGYSYVLQCMNVALHNPLIQNARQYVQQMSPEVRNVHSFERIADSLAENTNTGRLLMIYLYAEELKQNLPDQMSDIDRILRDCLQKGFMELIRVKGMAALL